MNNQLTPMRFETAEPQSLIKIARQAQGLSQTALADLVGRTRQTIQAAESRGTEDEALTIALAVRLGLPTNEEVLGSIRCATRYSKWQLTAEAEDDGTT